jgi:hypothetical protein
MNMKANGSKIIDMEKVFSRREQLEELKKDSIKMIKS